MSRYIFYILTSFMQIQGANIIQKYLLGDIVVVGSIEIIKVVLVSNYE